MAQSRIEVFQAMVLQQPDEVMIWYGLGSELFKVERWAEAAEALATVIRLNPDYTAAYQMLGSALNSEGKTNEARAIWQTGIEVADRTGAWKARQHLESLLANTEAKPANEFCD
jgi:predicted Zn-dependent protease